MVKMLKRLTAKSVKFYLWYALLERESFHQTYRNCKQFKRNTVHFPQICTTPTSVGCCSAFAFLTVLLSTTMYLQIPVLSYNT